MHLHLLLPTFGTIAFQKFEMDKSHYVKIKRWLQASISVFCCSPEAPSRSSLELNLVDLVGLTGPHLGRHAR